MSETTKTVEHYGYFQVGAYPLYSTLFRPVGPPTGALLLVEPFGEEKRCAHRMLVRMARKLAGAGLAILKFDFSGTGDSGGQHADADWPVWRAEIAAAAAFLQEQCGAVPLALLGSRAGALLAAEAAATLPLHKLLLIEPLLSGEELVLDLLRREKIKGALQGQGGVDPELGWAAGQTADFGGIQVTATLAAAARRSVLLDSLQKLPETLPILLLRVSGGKKLPPAWEPLVARVQKTPGGIARIVADKPFWGQLEYYESEIVIDAVADFLLNPERDPSVQ